jgi:RNA polymerase sigma-70 factor (ECF subfamily)
MTSENTLPDDRSSIRSEFETLVARTKRQAYNMAYRMTGNREDAEDLTQEAYLRAFRSFEKYNRSLPFENWFFRILSNLFVDGLRRKPKQTPLSLNQPVNANMGEDEYMLEIADEESNPEDQLLKQVMDERLQRALASLPAEFRTAVLLCDVEEMSYQQIAERMQTSIGTVRSRIHRGRLMLRKYMLQDTAPPRRAPALKPLAI